MAEAPPGQQRFQTALARIQKKLNDALNKPPSEASRLSELEAQLVAATRFAIEQDLSERDALIQAGSAAPSFEFLEKDIATEEQAPPLPGARPPQRKVYTLDDAQTFLADSQIMAEQLVFQRSGRQSDRATQRIIGAYLIENLLGEQRGAPDGSIEGFAEQVVSLQGEAVVRDPSRVTLAPRIRAAADALLDSDNPNAQIDQETYNALVFPATPFEQIPARHRASVPPSGAAIREAELKALDVASNISDNMLANLQKFVDISGGPTGVSNLPEGFARIASEQGEEEVLAGTATLPSVNSPSEIRAQQREQTALSALETESSTKKALEDQVGSPGLLTNADAKTNKTQAIRLGIDRLQAERRDFLSDNRGASKEEIAAHLAPFVAQEVENFDQTLAAVSQEFEAQKFRDLESTTAELKAILGREGLDASQIDDELLTRTAQFVMESENPITTAQTIVGAFGALADESRRLREVGNLDLAEKHITDALGARGLDAEDIPEDIFEDLKFGAVQSGRIDIEAIAAAFPSFQQAGENLRRQEALTDVTGANSLRDKELFRLGETPQDFTPEQLNAMSQFIAQSGGTQGFEQTFGPNFERLKQAKVLGGLFPEGRPAVQFGADRFPTFGELGALRSLDTPLGVAPAGNIAPIRAGQIQTSGSIRRDIAVQTGVLPPTFSTPQFEPFQGAEDVADPRNLATVRAALGNLGADDALDEEGIRRQETLLGQETRLLGNRRAIPGLPGFGRVQQPEPPIGFDEITPLLRGLAGDNLAFLSFLFQPEQLRGLQTGFGAARRRDIATQRADIRASGVEASRGRASARRGLARVGEGGVGEGALREAEGFFDERIRTATQLGRMTSSSRTFPQFAESQVGGLRATFAASPAGLQEEQRAESEAERTRRRRLRGGRTVFQRI